MRDRLGAIAMIVFGLPAIAAGWEWNGPRRTVERMTAFAPIDDITAHMDRDALKRGFAAQMEPEVDSYAPPYDKASVLTYMTDPRAVRAFLIEPYGDWQFAAAEGLPDNPKSQNVGDPMPRILETADAWAIERTEWDRFVAYGTRAAATSASRPTNRYHFRRDGTEWVLERIESPGTIR